MTTQPLPPSPGEWNPPQSSPGGGPLPRKSHTLRNWLLIALGVFIGLVVLGSLLPDKKDDKSSAASRSTTSEQGAATTTTTETSAEPAKLDGSQEYKNAQALADELTRLGRRCDMTPEGGGSYFSDGGRCYLGGSSGPEVVLLTYTSQSQIDRYNNEVPGGHAWLVGKNWIVNCHDGDPPLCDELQGLLGGKVERLADSGPPPPQKMPPPMSADDQEIAATAKRWVLEGFGEPGDGSFTNIPCTDEGVTYCWSPYINDFAYSNGVLYVLMDTDWTQQPDGARNVTAQNRVASLLRLGPGPKLVMDNVKTVQSVDRNGVVRSDATI